MKKIQLLDKKFKLYIPFSEIEKNISVVAQQLNRDFADEPCPLFICTLDGAFMFTANLLQKLKLNCEVSFVKVSSYQGTRSSGEIREILGLNTTVKGRSVIILEDIVDSGLTIEFLDKLIKKQQPKQVKVCTMLFKPETYRKNIPIDYTAMCIPNDFIVGFGLDYNQLGRQLKDIYVLEK